MTKEEIKTLLNSPVITRWKTTYNKVQKLHQETQDINILFQNVNQYKQQLTKDYFNLWELILQFYLKSTNNFKIEKKSFYQWSDQFIKKCHYFTKTNNKYQENMDIILSEIKNLKTEIRIKRSIYQFNLIALNFEKEQLIRNNAKARCKVSKLYQKQETKLFKLLTNILKFITLNYYDYQQKHTNKIKKQVTLMKTNFLRLKEIESEIKENEIKIKEVTEKNITINNKSITNQSCNVIAKDNIKVINEEVLPYHPPLTHSNSFNKLVL